MPNTLLLPQPGRHMPEVNPDCLQAVGLRAWWPVIGSHEAGFWRSPTVTGVGLSLSNVTRSNDPVLGPVFSFNASAGGISTTGAVPETAAWTIAAWLRPTSTSGNVLIAGHVNSLSSASTWSTILGMRAGILDGYFFNGSARHTTGTTTLSTSTLYHVAFTADTAANLYALYINGVADTASSPSTTTAPSAAVNQFGVGCTTGSQAGNDFTTRYSGTLGEVRRYNRALDAGEVWQLWAAETRWALYKPSRRSQWFVLVAGPTTIGLGSLGATAQSVTVAGHTATAIGTLGLGGLAAEATARTATAIGRLGAVGMELSMSGDNRVDSALGALGVVGLSTSTRQELTIVPGSLSTLFVGI